MTDLELQELADKICSTIDVNAIYAKPFELNLEDFHIALSKSYIPNMYILEVIQTKLYIRSYAHISNIHNSVLYVALKDIFVNISGFIVDNITT